MPNAFDTEIFAVGKWNGMSFSVDDLKEIADNFSALAENHKVPLKFGHNEQQPLVDGQPALGWVTKIWLNESNKLVARFEHVPDIVKSAIEKKLYRHVSVELDCDVEHKGRKYKYVLSAVAILGADIPAVNTIGDLGKYLGEGQPLAASRRMNFSAIEIKEEYKMTEEDVLKIVETTLAPIVAELEKLAAKNSETKAEIETEKSKMHRAALLEQLESAVKLNRILPTQRDSAIKFMRINDDVAVKGITAEQIEEYVASNGTKANFSQSGRYWPVSTVATDDDPGTEIIAKAKALQSLDSKLSFSMARDRVLSDNPDLARAWLVNNN